MADIDLKTEAPDTSINDSAFLFGADSQSASSPSVYAVSTVRAHFIGAGSLSVASGKTLTASNTLTLAGTDGTTMTFPSTSATLARTDAANTFTGGQTISGGTLNGTVLDVSQTWGGTGAYTGLKYNVTDSGPSNGSSLLMDLQVGGTSRFSVRKDGAIFIPSGQTIGNGTNLLAIGGGNIYPANSALTIGTANVPFGSLFVSTSSQVCWAAGGTADLFLTRRGAANLRLGAADAAAATSSTISVTASTDLVTWTSHGLMTGSAIRFSATSNGISAGTTYYVNVQSTSTFYLYADYTNAINGTATGRLDITSDGTNLTAIAATTQQSLSVQGFTGTNAPGSPLVINGSTGTGTGPGGDIVFRVAPAGAAPTTPNALSTALTISDAGQLTVTRIGSTASPYGTLATFQHGTNAWLTGLAYGGGGYAYFATGAVQIGGPGSNQNYGISLSNNSPIGWTSGANGPNTTLDTILARDNTGILALRNGTAAQRFNVYNTWTSATNYEAFKIDWITTANTVLVGTEKGSGGGSARALALQVDGTTQITFNTGGYTVLNSAFYFEWSGRAVGIDSPSSGAIRLVGTNMLLQIGGNTSSFPALKRNSTALETKLADDSAYAPHAMQYLDVTDGITAPASATGRARIYVDTADGDLKVIFADGTVKTIVTDT